MSDITLEVNGKQFAGWEAGSVTLDMESIAGAFELSVSERWANQSQAWPIDEGDECKVMIGTKTLITGFVDKRAPEFDGGSGSLTISGRDKSANLVDCSADLGVWEFANFDVYDLAKKLCAPYGIHVALDPPLIGRLPKLKRMAINVGETGYNVLEQALRLAGLLAINDGDGEITLTRPGNDRAVTSLVQAQNLKSAKGNFDASSRFYKYRVLGQQGLWKELPGSTVAHVLAEATDPNIKDKTRILIIRPGSSVTKAQADLRVQWEATVRAARSDSVSATVQGWTQSDGSLWTINTLVNTVIPRLRVKGDMLISQVRFGVSRAQGTTTTLQLKRPDAFNPAPIVPNDGLWKELGGL